MKAVYLDGEHVDFSGAEPATLEALWSVIENHLSSQNRLIETFLLDGSPWLLGEEEVVSWKEVRIGSTTFGKRLAALISQWTGVRGEVLGRIDRLGEEVLRVPWGEAQSAASRELERLRPFLETMETLIGFANEGGLPWCEPLLGIYERFGKDLGRVVEMAQQGDCVRLSDCVSLDLRRSTGDLLVFLEEEAVPELEAWRV